jgi:myo-inositol-1(or 4)-monophosphatase
LLSILRQSGFSLIFPNRHQSNMKSYLQFGVEVAEKAGKIMLDYFATDVKKEWKEDNSPVTIADITVNKMVIESILKEYPTHGILGEEESFMQDSEYIWVCDPIDGTYSFLHGIPTFTFSLALTFRGEPIVAVVYDAVLKRMYTAEKEKGAFLNNKKITVSKASSFDRQLFGTEGRKMTVFNQEVFRELLYTKSVIFSALGSSTYACVLVASGEFIGAVFSNPKAWDCAAVKLLIDEAGGKATDLYGNEQRYDGALKGFVASNGKVHDELVEILSKSFNKKENENTLLQKTFHDSAILN